MPVHCWSIYLLCDIGAKTAQHMLQQVPAEALVVDYSQSMPGEMLGLRPKKVLEDRVNAQWQQVERFLHGHHIDLARLTEDDLHTMELMDDALDTLLGGHAHQFLQVATEFQRSLELARPLRLTKGQRSLYDMLVLLAHRVQSLTPGAFAHHFLEVYDENDTFFLYDPARGRRTVSSETLAEAFARHTEAGRHNLAQSLQLQAQNAL
jgi:hypothetical protein